MRCLILTALILLTSVPAHAQRRTPAEPTVGAVVQTVDFILRKARTTITTRSEPHKLSSVTVHMNTVSKTTDGLSGDLSVVNAGVSSEISKTQKTTVKLKIDPDKIGPEMKINTVQKDIRVSDQIAAAMIQFFKNRKGFPGIDANKGVAMTSNDLTLTYTTVIAEGASITAGLDFDPVKMKLTSGRSDSTGQEFIFHFGPEK